MRPHAHLDRERTPVEAERIRLGLTIDRGSALTQGRLSPSAWHRLERHGRGSPRAWQTVAAVLGVDVEVIRRSPARGTALVGSQLALWPASSS